MAKKTPSILNFADADRYLGSKSDRPAYRGKSTRVRRIDADSIGILLHQTYVVTYHRDGRIILNSGGWRTVTTKARINEFSPASVHQKDFAWYLNGEDFEDGVNVGLDVQKELSEIFGPNPAAQD
jgi:hypothetical protein